MDVHASVKLLHVLSATLLFGTGLGTAFFMWRAHASGSREAMRVTSANVVLADWIFTAPSAVVQLATGLWLTARLGISPASLWFVLVLSSFCLVGACWLPVVWIQKRIRDLLSRGADRADYAMLMRIWLALGIPAFAGMLALFALMISRFGTQVSVLSR